MTLQQYLDAKKITTQQFAAMVKASYSITSKWRQGQAIPRRHWVIKIERITNGKVKPEDWYK